MEFAFTTKSFSLFELLLYLFKEALLLEMSYNKKRCLCLQLIVPQAKQNEFDFFLSNLEIFLSGINKCKLYLSVVKGDFNARPSYWWCKDINTAEGLNLFSLMSSNGFSQLINKPTNTQTSSSCIDLIFTDQPNLSTNAGVHSTLHSNCHHQIVHSGFNLNIYYLPPYQRLI